jgi:hypothetical protein
MPELICQNCQAPHPPWSAENEIWNEVVNDDEHFLCPTCFIRLAEKRGVIGIWRLSFDQRGGSLISQCIRNSNERELDAISYFLDGKLPEGSR